VDVRGTSVGGKCERSVVGSGMEKNKKTNKSLLIY